MSKLAQDKKEDRRDKSSANEIWRNIKGKLYSNHTLKTTFTLALFHLGQPNWSLRDSPHNLIDDLQDLYDIV